jgi:tripartite-type tricarboxylate transporter receptor subunit TctC
MALVSGQVDLNFDNLAGAAANVRSGKLKALAVTTATRSRALPDVPTLAEAGKALGLAQFDVSTWFGVFGPAKLPAAELTRLHRAFSEALESSEVKARLRTMMAESVPNTPEQFSRFVQAESDKYRAVVQALGVKAE